MIFKSLNFIPRVYDATALNHLDFVKVSYAHVLNPSVYHAIDIYVHRKVFNAESRMTQYVVTHDDRTFLLNEEELNNLVKVCIVNNNLSYDSYCTNILNEIKSS